MRSVRISTTLHDSLRLGLLNSYATRIAARHQKIQSFALKVYSAMFSERDVNMAKALGDQWVSTASEMFVFLAPKDTSIDFAPIRFCFSFAPAVVVPRTVHTARYHTQINGAPFIVRLDASVPWEHTLLCAVQDLQKLEKERDELVNKMMAIVNQCRSTKQLAAVWPSFIEYASEEERKKLFTPIVRSSVKSVQAELEIDPATSLLLVKARLSK